MDGGVISYDLRGLKLADARVLFVWGHGWGMSRHVFAPFVESLASRAAHLCIDFPGFGQSPVPPDTWGTADYAKAVADLVRPYRHITKIIWVGHSFGGRVAIQAAARHPELVDGLFLIACAGLPRQRNLIEKLHMRSRITLFKTLKFLAPLLKFDLDALRSHFGSADYRSAGVLRPIFVRVVRENLSESASLITCPTSLVYGQNDRETPPEMGRRLNDLIKGSLFSVLPGEDHYTVLTSGRHLVLKHIVTFLEALA